MIAESGPVSLVDIRDEFGGSNPISMSSYYRNGPYVDTNGSTGSIPTSGTISISQFRGTSDTLGGL